jgi:hypothetical protein
MFPLRPLHLCLLPAVAVVLIVARPAEAQLTSESIHAEANRLHDQAMEPVHAIYSPESLVLATRMHGQAASIRLPNDPRACEYHQFQANLHYLLGEFAEARALLELAAGVAIANGDFGQAALAYVEAATVAVEEGQRRDAARLIREAQHLTMNPAVPAADRQRIQDRIR